MKKLNECKEYFKELHLNCSKYNSFQKNIFDSTELAQYEAFCDVLDFIYGSEFQQVKSVWINEALNEFYNQNQ